jgi:hypothetical protein
VTNALNYEQVKEALDDAEANDYQMKGMDNLDIALDMIAFWDEAEGKDTNELIPLIERWKQEHD